MALAESSLRLLLPNGFVPPPPLLVVLKDTMCLALVFTAFPFHHYFPIAPRESFPATAADVVERLGMAIQRVQGALLDTTRFSCFPI